LQKLQVGGAVVNFHQEWWFSARSASHRDVLVKTPRGPPKKGQGTAKSGLARKLSCSCQDCTVWAPTAKPLKQNALDPKLSCSCQEAAAAGVASDPAAAAVHGCFPPVADSAAATASGSQDVPLATASDFPRRPGDTRCQSQASCGDSRCGADVGTPADCTRFVEDDKRRVEMNDDSKDNGGTGSSRLLRESWDESLRRIETSSGTQACGEKLI